MRSCDNSTWFVTCDFQREAGAGLDDVTRFKVILKNITNDFFHSHLRFDFDAFGRVDENHLRPSL